MRTRIPDYEKIHQTLLDCLGAINVFFVTAKDLMGQSFYKVFATYYDHDDLRWNIRLNPKKYPNSIRFITDFMMDAWLEEDKDYKFIRALYGDAERMDETVDVEFSFYSNLPIDRFTCVEEAMMRCDLVGGGTRNEGKLIGYLTWLNLKTQKRIKEIENGKTKKQNDEADRQRNVGKGTVQR